MARELNRKTNIPIKSTPVIVEWLLKNCTKEEIFFLSDLASNRKNFNLLNSIISRLTDYNIYEVFYDNSIQDGEDLRVFRAAKRGEVAGLKAFSYACQAAKENVLARKGGE